MADDMLSLEVLAKDIVYSSISTSKNGYNYASITVKKGYNEYINISYDWEGDTIPSFAMELMALMKSNKVETSGVWPGREEDYSKIKGRP